jgi:hypothetical protein
MKFKTDKEYFADTTHISASMIKAYLRSPSYYKALYIDKVLAGPDSPAIDFGSALDTLLTESEEEFHKGFTYSVLKRDDPERFESNKTFAGKVLSRSAYDTVLAAANAVQATTAYKDIMNNEPLPQTVLTGNINGVDVKGKLDWLNIIDLKSGGKKAIITDLKTTTNLHPTKYYYHALDFGYHVQMAMYKELVMQNFDVMDVTCQHLVVTKNDWPIVATFEFGSSLIQKGMDQIEYALQGITEQKFEEKDVGWDNAFILDIKE